MGDADAYRDRIRAIDPALPLDAAVVVEEGAANAVVIVDDAWVFRIARNESARASLEREARLLAVLPRHVELSVPESTFYPPDTMRQRKLHGQPLDRHTLLRQPPDVQERLVEQLARFLFELHRVPEPELRQAGVAPTEAAVGPAEARELYETVERELVPHLKSYVVARMREHFRPVLSGELDLGFDPVLVHADLNPSHLLWAPQEGRLTGVLDFGMAGLGDSAIDYAFIILTYGETPLRWMRQHHPGIGPKIDRARFWALASQLRFVLSAIRTREPRWIVGHLGAALDVLPIGTPWD